MAYQVLAQDDTDALLALARAEGLGARGVESFVEDDGYGWWVLADPEANLFCIGRLGD